MLAMAALGIGEIVGGIGMGIIVDKIGPKKASFIICSLVVIQTVLLSIFCYLNIYIGWLTYLMAFAWGV